MWEYHDSLRIYTKPKVAAPDFNEPVILPRKKCSIEHFCGKLHKSLKYALVWGDSVKHFPQRVGKDHVLCPIES